MHRTELIRGACTRDCVGRTTDRWETDEVVSEVKFKKERVPLGDTTILELDKYEEGPGFLRESRGEGGVGGTTTPGVCNIAVVNDVRMHAHGEPPTQRQSPPHRWRHGCEMTLQCDSAMKMSLCRTAQGGF